MTIQTWETGCSLEDALAYVRSMESKWGNENPRIQEHYKFRQEGGLIWRVVAGNHTDSLVNQWDVWIDGVRGIYGEC